MSDINLRDVIQRRMRKTGSNGSSQEFKCYPLGRTYNEFLASANSCVLLRWIAAFLARASESEEERLSK
jgi:hypothetical protein